MALLPSLVHMSTVRQERCAEHGKLVGRTGHAKQAQALRWPPVRDQLTQDALAALDGEADHPAHESDAGHRPHRHQRRARARAQDLAARARLEDQTRPRSLVTASMSAERRQPGKARVSAMLDEDTADKTSRARLKAHALNRHDGERARAHGCAARVQLDLKRPTREVRG